MLCINWAAINTHPCIPILLLWVDEMQSKHISLVYLFIWYSHSLEAYYCTICKVKVSYLWNNKNNTLVVIFYIIPSIIYYSTFFRSFSLSYVLVYFSGVWRCFSVTWRIRCQQTRLLQQFKVSDPVTKQLHFDWNISYFSLMNNIPRGIMRLLVCNIQFNWSVRVIV